MLLSYYCYHRPCLAHIRKYLVIYTVQFHCAIIYSFMHYTLNHRYMIQVDTQSALVFPIPSVIQYS